MLTTIILWALAHFAHAPMWVYELIVIRAIFLVGDTMYKFGKKQGGE